MKTKLTTEEREQFFGLYWGQRVMRTVITNTRSWDCGDPSELMIVDSIASWVPSYYLSLKSLSSISDEDAIEVFEIEGSVNLKRVEYSEVGYRGFKLFRELRGKEVMHFVMLRDLTIVQGDFLRRLGYLIGATLMNKEGVCTHYTAEELIEDGIVKIKQYNDGGENILRWQK